MREPLPEPNRRLFDDGKALPLAVDGETRLVVAEVDDWPWPDDRDRSSNSELLNLEVGVEPAPGATLVGVVDAGGRGGGVSSRGVLWLFGVDGRGLSSLVGDGDFGGVDDVEPPPAEGAAVR